MEPAVLSAVVIALGSLAVALVTARQNRKGAAATNAISERVVNREDFESIVKELRQSLADVKADLEVEVKARKEADARAERAEKRAEAAEQRADRLERRVSQLEQVLRDNQISVPPVPPES